MTSPQSLVALLRWYVDMGVDIAAGDAPHDYLAEAAALAAAQDAPPPALAAREAPNPADLTAPLRPLRAAAPLALLEEDAREAAAAAPTLEALRDALARFEGCALRTTATQLVFSDGQAGAEVMFVGEAPGADEDRQGVPFVGRAGQLLNRMLAAIGLARADVYIANVVPWRPPGNRTPTPLETAACLPFLRRQIELVAPKILVCLGKPSAQTLLDSKESITRLRGRWLAYDCGGRKIKALATLHPAFLLRQPGKKPLAWQDFRLVARELARLHEAGRPDA